jgi:protein Mpv17
MIANTAMFASFLTIGDYLAIQVEEKLNAKPKHHPVHRTQHHDSMALAKSVTHLPDHFVHHHHQHPHNHSKQVDSTQQALVPALDSSNNNNNSKQAANEGSLLHKLSCVFKSGLIIGTLNHYWYVLLDGRLPGHAGKIVALKVLLDQLVASNLTNAGFFMTCGLFEGKTPQQCTNELSAKYLFLYLSDIIFWVPAQAINFKYVPAKYRVAYVSAATVVWNIFLCYHRNNDIQAILLKPKEKQANHVPHLHTA